MSALAGLLSGCGTPPPSALPTAGASVTVIERGWHTDVGLAADQLAGPLARLREAYPGARFLVFGFGDRAFYMSRQETLGETLAALFPGPGVVLLTALGASPQDAFDAGQVVTLWLPQPDLDRIAAFIWQTLDKRDDGSLVRLGDGPYAGSAFYASRRTYDAFDNCNSWTALALHSGGLPIDPDGVLFAGQVMTQARRLAAAAGWNKADLQWQGGEVPSAQTTVVP